MAGDTSIHGDRWVHAGVCQMVDAVGRAAGGGWPGDDGLDQVLHSFDVTAVADAFLDLIMDGPLSHPD